MLANKDQSPVDDISIKSGCFVVLFKRTMVSNMSHDLNRSLTDLLLTTHARVKHSG